MNKTILLIGAIAAGVIVLACLIYGAIRKFSRITWIGFQVPMAFGLTLLLKFIPPFGNQWLDLAVAGGGLMLSVAITLGIGGLVRRFMFSPKRQKPGTGVRVCNRLLGALSALLALLVFLVVVGAFALKACETFEVLGSQLSVVYGNPVWSNFFTGYAADLLLVSVFLIVMRAGFRLGLLRSIYVLIMFALTAAAFVGAILFTTKLGFMCTFAGMMAGWFSSLQPAVANLIGYCIAIAIVFLVFFLVVMLIGALLNFLIKKINSVRVIAFVDGLIVCILYTAFFLVLMFGLYYATWLIAGGVLDKLLQGLGDAASAFPTAVISGFAEKLAALFSSSPLCSQLFNGNPLILLIGMIGA